jgi:hypothetical protein
VTPCKAPRRSANCASDDARKLVEIANGIEAVQGGRIYIELVNSAFLDAAARRTSTAALACAISKGWLWRHESRTCVKFT